MRGIASLSKGVEKIFVEKIEDFLKQASAAKDAAEAKKAKPARIDTAEISQKWGQAHAMTINFHAGG